MNTKIFVNEAINSGITNYINKQNDNDMITQFIKILITIYGDLDIINPYKAANESGMGGFDENVCKFGYSKEQLTLFKKNMSDFYTSSNKKPNSKYNKIITQFIDMFFIKKKAVDNMDSKAFEELIFADDQGYSSSMDEIKRYYSFMKKQDSYNIGYSIKKNNLLSDSAYEAIGYSYDNVKKMADDKINELNEEVFKYFEIDTTKDDKYLRLEQAIKYYDEYPKDGQNKEANGYVEFLLLSGFISITLLVVIVLVGVVLR